MHFERPARVSLWIAGAFICLLSGLAIVAVVRSIPASASIPNERASLQRAETPIAPEDAHVGTPLAPLAGERSAVNRRTPARCSECGVIESMRQIQRSGNVGSKDADRIRDAAGGSGSTSGPALAAAATAGMSYEFTVRFRDGSTMVLNQAGPTGWQLGSRVIVVRRTEGSNH